MHNVWPNLHHCSSLGGIKSNKRWKKRHKWTLFSQLDDQDYADDIALVSHTAKHIQQKTEKISEYGEQIGLRVKSKKTKLMTVNIKKFTITGMNL